MSKHNGYSLFCLFVCFCILSVIIVILFVLPYAYFSIFPLFCSGFCFGFVCLFVFLAFGGYAEIEANTKCPVCDIMLNYIQLKFEK